MIKPLARFILGHTLKPFLQHYYLRRTRPFRYDGLMLTIAPGVFHPGLFFSSKFFAEFIKQQNLSNKRLLDVGCGSGLLSLVAAKQGANVSAVDLNDAALFNCQTNALSNNLVIDAVKSDIFSQVEGTFDYIVVNPPYYPRQPQNASQLAWYCGDDFGYFKRFFTDLNQHITADSRVFMVLSDGCDVDTIANIATKHHFTLVKLQQRNMWLEWQFIYQLSPIPPIADHH